MHRGGPHGGVLTGGSQPISAKLFSPQYHRMRTRDDAPIDRFEREIAALRSRPGNPLMPLTRDKRWARSIPAAIDCMLSPEPRENPGG